MSLDESLCAGGTTGHMMQRALPLGPLANVTARYVRRSKLHHRDCYLLRNPSVETAPLGGIAHRPYCSACDGPGFDLSDDHLDYLWAVMVVDEVTGDLNTRLRQSHSFDGPDTLEAWRQQRRDEVDACHEVIAIVGALSLAEPRIKKLAVDAALRVRHRTGVLETKLLTGPDPSELPPDHVVVRGKEAIQEWRVTKWRTPPDQKAAIAVPQGPMAGGIHEFTSRPASRIVDTPRTRNRVRAPGYITGLTQQRVELARTIQTAGRARSDPALAHPIWSASYEWMAAKLVEKHPASVEGPPLEDADRWWDRYQVDHPEEAERRERSTETLDALRRAAQ